MFLAEKVEEIASEVAEHCADGASHFLDRKGLEAMV